MKDKNKKLVSALLGLSAALPANPQISAKNEVSETQKIQKSEQNFVPSFETGFSGTVALALTALGVGGIYLANKDKPFVKNFDVPSNNTPDLVRNPYNHTFKEIGKFIDGIKAEIVDKNKKFKDGVDFNNVENVKTWRKSCNIAYVVGKDGEFYKVTNWDEFITKNPNGFKSDINVEGQTSVSSPEEEGYLKCIFNELHDRVCSTFGDNDAKKKDVKISHIVFGLDSEKDDANIVLTLAYGNGDLSDPGGFWSTFHKGGKAFTGNDVDGFQIETNALGWGDAVGLDPVARPLPILLANDKAPCGFAEIKFEKSERVEILGEAEV